MLINIQKCLRAKMPKLSKKCLKATNAEKKQKCLRAKMPRGKKYPNMQTCLWAINAQIKQKMLKSNKCSLKGKNA
jgi:hypothetical protein